MEESIILMIDIETIIEAIKINADIPIIGLYLTHTIAKISKNVIVAAINAIRKTAKTILTLISIWIKGINVKNWVKGENIIK